MSARSTSAGLGTTSRALFFLQDWARQLFISLCAQHGRKVLSLTSTTYTLTPHEYSITALCRYETQIALDGGCLDDLNDFFASGRLNPELTRVLTEGVAALVAGLHPELWTLTTISSYDPSQHKAHVSFSWYAAEL